MFIHVFFVNVQSCSVLNACYLWIRYFVIQSCFLSTTPRISCRHIFHDFLHSHFHLCLSHHRYFSCTASLLLADCFNPGRCPLLTAPKIPALWHRSLGSHCSTDSFISTLSVRRFTATNIEFYTVCWHDSLLLVDRHLLWLFDLTSGRLTVPSEPSSIANNAILFITSVGSSASTLRSVASKDSEHHHRVEHHFTPPRVHPAPHHRLLVSALFYRFPRTVHIHVLHFSSSVAIAGHSRAR